MPTSKRPPDRLCTERGSRWFNGRDAERIEISIDGVKQAGRVVEYCMSKGWARCLVFGPDGQPRPGALGLGKRTEMVHGVIRVWWKGEAEPPNTIAAAPRPEPGAAIADAPRACQGGVVPGWTP